MSDDFDRLMQQYDPGIREISEQARHLVAKLVPKAEQKVYFGWRILRFSVNGEMSGQFCAIGPGKKYVNLYFMNGTSLNDPKGLLEGTGKNMRHVKLEDPKALNNAALKTLIKAAAQLQREKLGA